MAPPRHRHPSYEAMHARLDREVGKASQFPCEHCGEQAKEWAYNKEDPHERQSKRGLFSESIEFYIPLCVSCHRRFDNNNSCRRGHEFTEQNTYVYRGYRLCRECRRRNMADYYRRKR